MDYRLNDEMMESEKCRWEEDIGALTNKYRSVLVARDNYFKEAIQKLTEKNDREKEELLQ